MLSQLFYYISMVRRQIVVNDIFFQIKFINFLFSIYVVNGKFSIDFYDDTLDAYLKTNAVPKTRLFIAVFRRKMNVYEKYYFFFKPKTYSNISYIVQFKTWSKPFYRAIDNLNNVSNY